MIAKYESIKHDVFEALNNMIEAGMNPRQASLEISTKYPVFVALFKVDHEMLQEWTEWMAEFAYYVKNKKFFKEN